MNISQCCRTIFSCFPCCRSNSDSEEENEVYSEASAGKNTIHEKAGASLDGNHKVSIAGLNKAEVLVTLFNNSRPQGLGIFSPGAFENMSVMRIDRAQQYTDRTLNFDYVDGRVIQTDISGDVMDTRFYDRDNGSGAGLKAIQKLVIPPSYATVSG